jgi:hypothetical protein
VPITHHPPDTSIACLHSCTARPSSLPPFASPPPLCPRPCERTNKRVGEAPFPANNASELAKGAMGLVIVLRGLGKGFRSEWHGNSR